MNRIKTLAVAKVSFALLGFSSIIIEIATLTERGRFNPANFFSFFTIQSNILIVIALLLGASALLAGRKSHLLDMFRGATTFYMVTTGVVFSILLSGLDSSLLTAVAWDNIVLHYIMPVVALVDWLIDRPKTKLVFSRAVIWLAYPIAYVVYSLIRGAAVGWYPYPFLNAAEHGYIYVLIVCLGIVIFGLAVVYMLTWHRPKK